jgi:hypothetical protein
MKSRWLLFSILVLCITTVAVGQDVQEILTGGNMENAGAWTVNHLNSADTSEYLFNYTDDVPSSGAGGCLYVYGSSNAEINTLFWQKVTLLAGATYEISGAFKDLTGGLLKDFWCDIVLTTEEPPKTAGNNWKPLNDTNSDIRVSMNTWSGCGPGVDGTFEDNGCSGTGASYEVPGTPGESIPYYFGIKPGLYTSGTQSVFEIAIDEVSLKGPSAATGIHAKPSGIVSRFELHQNYPNPFNPATRISYTLRENGKIRLSVFDSMGREVAVLADGAQNSGNHEILFEGMGLPSGNYFYRLRTANEMIEKKMTLLK